MIFNKMKKYAVNYSRTFPDHRVPIDYHFNKELMKGPSTYFRLLKNSFNITGVKNFHIWLSIFATGALLVVGTIKFWNHDSKTTNLQKRSFPAYKYAQLSMEGGYGAYDIILQKFEGEPGGLRDLPFEE